MDWTLAFHLLVVLSVVATGLFFLGCYLCWLFDRKTYDPDNHSLTSNGQHDCERHRLREFHHQGRRSYTNERYADFWDFMASSTIPSSLSTPSSPAASYIAVTAATSRSPSPFPGAHSRFLEVSSLSSARNSRRNSGILSEDDLPNYEAVSGTLDKSSPPSYAECMSLSANKLEP